MRSMTFQIDDRSTGTLVPAVTVTITENADGTLTFTLTQTGPLIGDLRGIFFDVADETLIPSLTVSADSGGLTEVRTGDDSVVDLGGGANLQGLVGSDGGYDAGLEIGTSGIGADDQRTFSFTLSAARALSLEDFANVDFGVRLTSVGEDGGERTASAKLLETVSGVLDAIDDQASVQEDGPLSVSGNVLGNDSGAGASATVIAVNGAASNVGAEIAGSYGVLRLQADGSYVYVLDNAAVQTLAEGETLIEQFSYAARTYGDATSYSDDTAQLVVTIVGTNDGPVAQAITQSANEDGPSVTLNAVYTDVDTSDTHGFSVDSSATLGAVTSNGDGTFSYSANGAFEYLNAGQTATDTFAYTVSDNHGASSTQTATVTVTGQNDAPVTTGGTTTGAVYEDGSRRAEGQLGATDVDQGAVLTWSVTNPGVLATPDYRFLMDNFRIVRNGVQYYNDDFGDNNPPPSAPGVLNEAFPTSTSYFLPAGSSFQESGGRLIMDGARSVPTAPVGSPDPFHAHSATLNTDTSADLTRGLKIDDSFTVEGRFDLVMPDERQAYGVRLIDFNGSDVVDVRVRREDGVVYVVLREADVPANTVTTLARIALEPAAGENQIVLRLTHSPSDPGAIQASFDLLGGPVARSFSFGSTVGHVFGTGTPGNPGDDEVFVRAQIVAVAPSDVQNGVYGTLHIDNNGHWNYVLDNGAANVQALALGEHATDTFTVRVTDEHGASATQTVTVDVVGSNDSPVISGAFTSGFVVEDFGPSVATGQLTAVDPDHGAAIEWTVTRGVAQGPGFVSSGQADYLVRVDELQIVRNGALLFRDSFDAGGPPPAAPNYSLPPFPLASYSTAGIFSEQGGKLVMDGSLASVFNGVANNDLQAGHSATLLTDTNPADLTRGLKSDDSFEITARFDLTLPAEGHLYGITLNDQSNGGVPPDQLGENTLAVIVRRDASGQLLVQFNELNVVADTASIASLPFDPLAGEDQIVLRLTHDKDNVGVVHASFDLVSSTGGTSRNFAFSEVRHIFGTATPDYAGDDENWVRVAITTRAPDTQGDPNAGGDTYAGTYGTMHVSQSGTWTYTLDNSLASTQSLAQNQFATDQFAIRAADQYGASSVRFVPVTISGSNDAPVGTGGITTGSVQEDGAAGAAGAVTFTDVDVSDLHSASFTASPSNTTSLGTFTLGALSELPNAADGSVSWSYDLDNAMAQYLAEGQSITETYTVNVQDNWGAVGTQDIAVTIAGANDAPVITTASGGGGGDSGVPNGSFEDGLSGWLTSGFVFLNYGNATDGSYSAYLQAGAVWYSDLEAFLGVAPGTIGALQPETGATTGSAMSRQITLNAGQTLTFDWQFIANDYLPYNDFSFFTVAPLSASELADVAMVGSFGNSGWQAGQYTAPVSGTYNIGFGVVNVFDSGFSSILNIDRVAIAGAGGGAPGAHITEDGMTSAAGSLGFADVDLADVHTAYATPAGSGYLGALSAFVTSDSTGIGGGIMTWSFSADNADLQQLSEGEARTQTYSVSVDDGHGGVASRDVTITLHGVNDAPMALFVPAEANEDGPAVVVTAAYTDPDALDSHTFSVGTAGTVGSVIDNGDGTFAYSPNGQFEYLGAGQSALDFFTYAVFDNHGGSSPGNVTVAVIGQNDAPTAVNDSLAGEVTEDEVGILHVLANDFDIDSGDTFSITAVGASQFGASVSLNADGTLRYDARASAELQDLNDGETRVDTFTYAITDNHGATSTATASVLVHGVNDFNNTPPVALDDSNAGDPVYDTGSIPPNFFFDSSASGNVLANDTDADPGSTLSVVAVNGDPNAVGTVLAGVYGSLLLSADGGWSYTASDAATNPLAVGETAFDTFTYAASDQFGATSTASLSVAVTGTNDAPVPQAGGDTGSVTEDTSPVTSGQLAASDPDHGATLRWSLQGGTVFLPGHALASGVYGLMHLDLVTGHWDYGLNTGAANVQSFAAGQTVQEQFTALVIDEHNVAAPQTITVTLNGANDAPVANADAASTGENQAVLIDVLANDTDVDNGAVLTLVSASAPAGQGSAGISNGQVRFNPGSDFDHLDAGEQATVTLSYTVQDEHGAQSSSTIDVIVTGETDLAVDGRVFEDGARRASGQLDIAGLDDSLPLTAVVTGSGSGAPMVNYRFLIDELSITRNGVEVFSDEFSNNQAPPAGASFAGTSTTYGMLGTFLESGDRAIMDGLNSAGIQGGQGNFATLLTDNNSANTTAGLKRNHAFTVEGRFDLVAPEINGQGYGIRLTDVLNGVGNDIIEVAVRRVGGELVAVLREIESINPTTATATTLETRTLNLAEGENQITLRLDHLANSDDITASFVVSDGATSRPVETFTQVGHAFAGETWTRAQIVSSSPTIPQNGLYGNLSVDADGNWAYQTRNNTGALQALAQDQMSTDVFTVQLTDAHGATTTQTVTIAANGTDDAPVFLASSQGSGFAVEDNVTQVKGTLFASDVDGGTVRRWTVSHPPLVGIGTTSAYDARFHFLLDEFRVERNGDTAYFVDDFANGTPAAPPTYLPNGLLGEVDGRMVMDGSGSAAVRGVGTDALRVGVSALLATNIDAADPTRGLKRADSFTVEGRYDLPVADESFFLPTKPKPGQFYGIALTDQTGNGLPPDQLGDDLVTVGLTSDGAGNLMVTFTDANSVSDVSTQLGSIALPTLQAGETQIVFRLEHAAGSGTVRAEFDLVGPGIAPEDVRSFAFTTEGHLFGSDTPDYAGDDENWTRAQVISFGEHTDQSYRGTYGTLSIDDFGVWTYNLDNAAANVQNLFQNQLVTDTFSVHVRDEYGVANFRTVSITVAGTSETPVPGPMIFNGSPANELVQGTDGNDLIAGGGGTDFLIGLGGSDSFIYRAATEGVDTIVDFTPGMAGDKLDIRDVLAGSYVPGVSNLSDFVQLAQVGSHQTLLVDANGTTGGAAFTALATLQGHTGLLLNDLIANQNLVVS